MSTPTPELSGAALFDAAWKAIGAPSRVTHYDWGMVPAMLDWLRARRGQGHTVINVWADGGTDAEQWLGAGKGHGRSLPEALARLVVRVAELEKQP